MCGRRCAGKSVRVKRACVRPEEVAVARRYTRQTAVLGNAKAAETVGRRLRQSVPSTGARGTYRYVQRQNAVMRGSEGGKNEPEAEATVGVPA